MEKVSFSGLGLKDWLVKQVSAVGFKDPKPVQVHCIPPILEGIAQAQRTPRVRK